MADGDHGKDEDDQKARQDKKPGIFHFEPGNVPAFVPRSSRASNVAADAFQPRPPIEQEAVAQAGGYGATSDSDYDAYQQGYYDDGYQDSRGMYANSYEAYQDSHNSYDSYAASTSATITVPQTLVKPVAADPQTRMLDLLQRVVAGTTKFQQLVMISPGSTATTTTTVKLSMDERIASVFPLTVHLASLSSDALAKECKKTLLPMDRSKLSQGTCLELVFEDVQASAAGDDRLKVAVVDCLIAVCRALNTHLHLFFDWAIDRLAGHAKYVDRDSCKKLWILVVLRKIYEEVVGNKISSISTATGADKEAPLRRCTENLLRAISDVLRSFEKVKEQGAPMATKFFAVLDVVAESMPGLFQARAAAIFDTLLQFRGKFDDKNDMKAAVEAFLASHTSNWHASLTPILKSIRSAAERQENNPKKLRQLLDLWLYAVICANIDSGDAKHEELLVTELGMMLKALDMAVTYSDKKGKPLIVAVESFCVDFLSRLGSGHALYNGRLLSFLMSIAKKLNAASSVKLCVSVVETAKKCVEMITTKSDKDEAFRIITEGFLPMRKLCATSFDLMKSIGIALSALCKRSHIDTLQLCRGDVQSVIAHLAGEELPSDVIPWTATPPSPYDIIFDIHYIFRKGTGDKDQLSMLLKFTQRLIAARTLEEYLTKFEDNPHESWDTTLVVALRYLSTSSTKQTSDEYISMLISAMADACPNIRRIATSLLLKLLGSTKPPSIRNGANQLVATVIQRLQFEQVHAIRSTLADLLKVTYEHDGIDLATRQATIITAYDCVADIATHDAALALLRRTHPLDVGTVDDQLMVRNSSYMQFACDLMQSDRTITLRPYHFVNAISWMIGSDQHTDVSAWLGDMYHSYVKADALSFRHSTNRLLFWLTCEMAHFCVITRLETVFNGGTETLDFFEASLRTLVEESTAESRLLASYTFLLFMDQLEKLMASAARGPFMSSSPQSWPALVSAFFCQNAIAHEQWFASIRPQLVRLAARVRCDIAFVELDGFVANHGMEVFLDQTGETKEALEDFAISTMDALASLKQPDLLNQFRVNANLEYSFFEIASSVAAECLDEMEVATIQSCNAHTFSGRLVTSLQGDRDLSEWTWPQDALPSTAPANDLFLITQTECVSAISKTLLLREASISKDSPRRIFDKTPGSPPVDLLTWCTDQRMSVPTCDATLAFARRSQEVGNVATAERLVAGLVNVQSPLDFKLIEGVAGIKLDIAHAQQPPTQIGAVIEELLVAHPRLVGSADFVSRLGALPPDVPFSSDALNIIFPKCEHDVDVHRQLFERALTIDPAFAEGHMRYADWILSSGTAVNACPSLAKYLTHVGDTVNGDVQVKAALQLLKIAVETGDAKHLKEASGASVWRLVLPQLFGVLRQTPPAVCDVVAEMIVAAGSTALPSVVYRLLSNDAHPASLVDHFRLAHRQLLTDTADFIAELSHISYLMEDRVLSSLMHFHDEIGKRFGSIKRLARSKEASVVQLQVESRLVPLVTALEASMSRLISNSNDKLDRPANEFEFLKAHSTSILEVIANLKQVVSDCPSDVTVIESAIAALTTIVTTLNKTFGGTRTVDLKSLSAKLLTLTNTCILIPGLARPVRLHALSTDVTILGTKTKPKKLIFIGEDGRKYPLLLKGTEDLHLDERVMQLLQVSNLGLQRTSRNYRETYRARHYAVVPIRERVGLIQWVDSAIPFYAMFKNWQIRKTATSADGVAVAGNTSTTVRRSMHSSRPIDYWSEKITRELAKRKISKSTSRRNWPVDALRKVFDELQAEAPQTLLMDELRSASSTASDWFQRRQQLTVSVAVMCILGHVIGLGDRHMDNQLFDLATGEIVHIDYNVCFDKGRRFRIPERVPFRLTQNLARVVRADPARGPFRAACDRTLTYLRESRGMVEHLLESFLHDPSISWLDSSVENTTQKSAEIDANVELLRMELDARAEAILELDRRLTEQLRATLGALSNAERQFDGNAQRMKTVATQLARLVNCWSTMVDQGKPIVLNTTTLLQTLCSIFSADDLVEHKQFAETANTARRAWRALQQKSVDAEETAKLMHSADRKTFISQLNAVTSMFKDIATIVATLFSSLDTIKRHSLLIGNNSLAEQMTGLAIDLDNVDEDVAPLSLFDDRDGTADGVARSLSQKSGGDAEGSLGTRSQAYRGATHDKEVSARISADRRSQLATRILDAVRGKLGGGSEREAERAMTSELIADAMNPDKLCQMYEGWMPFV